MESASVRDLLPAPLYMQHRAVPPTCMSSHLWTFNVEPLDIIPNYQDRRVNPG